VHKDNDTLNNKLDNLEWVDDMALFKEYHPSSHLKKDGEILQSLDIDK
jgi:hypothetical protein